MSENLYFGLKQDSRSHNNGGDTVAASLEIVSKRGNSMAPGI